MIVTRNDNGKLQINSLDLEILIGDIFGLCNTEHEVEFVQEAISNTVESEAESRLSDLE